MRTPIFYGYWLILAAFVAQMFATGVLSYIVGPFMTPMIEDLGWTRAEFTLPRTLGQVVMALVGFYVGSLVDQYGARRFMFAGVVVLAIALFLSSMITQLWQWVAINGVMITVGASLLGNLVVNVSLAKWFVDFRGRAIAFAAMGVSFAGVLLTPSITAIIDVYGWRPAWQLMAVGVLLLVTPAAAVMRRAPEDLGLRPDGRSEADVRAGLSERAHQDFLQSMTRPQALRTSAFYGLVLAFGLFGVTIQVMLLQTIPLMTDAGYSRTTAALMITIASIPALLSKPVWGWLIDGLQPKPLAAASSAITGLALFIIVIALDFQALELVMAGFILLGLGWGGMIPLQEVIWASYFGRRYLGAVRSAAIPFSLLFTAGAPLATSYYHDVVGNYDGAILSVGVANLTGAVLILLIRKPVTASLTVDPST